MNPGDKKINMESMKEKPINVVKDVASGTCREEGWVIILLTDTVSFGTIMREPGASA